MISVIISIYLIRDYFKFYLISYPIIMTSYTVSEFVIRQIQKNLPNYYLYHNFDLYPNVCHNLITFYL